MKLTTTDKIANELDKMVDNPIELMETIELLRKMGFPKEVDKAMIELASTYKKMYELTEHQMEIAENYITSDFDFDYKFWKILNKA